MLNGEKHSVYQLDWLDDYFNEIIHAQREFKGDLKIKIGIEVGYCPGIEKDIERIVNQYPLDFVLGAIHSLDHISISSKIDSPYYFRSRDAEVVREEYFSVLMEAVKTNFFDCVAHLDIYRRYGIHYLGPKVYTIHRGAIEPIFAEMKKRGMGLEINTSSRRRGLKEFHPSEEILDLAIQSGIKVFTVGSDAHSLDELGEGIDEALAMLERKNASNHIYTRRRAVPCLYPESNLHKLSSDL